MTIDMTLSWRYAVFMKTVSVAELKKRLSHFLVLARQGEEIEVRKRNEPMAHIVGIMPKPVNRTQLGRGQGTGRILGDLTESLLPTGHWDMLQGDL